MKDIYIEFKGSKIVGDVRDATHGSGKAVGSNPKPTIEVDSWSHLIRQPKSASSSTAGGHTSERCEHDEMVFVKDIDSASPKMWQAASQGMVTPEVEITFYRSSGSTANVAVGAANARVPYLVIKLKNVLISSIAPSVSEEGIPKETFGLKYSAVDWTYSASALDGTGTQSKSGTGAWNLATNTATFA
ncbi:MAG: type VI secretion system tube protein Hcp [Rubrivivax sp.]|nr:MAG: type VI secretion system tube protein Hcp [Rubrivivax sp.]